MTRMCCVCNKVEQGGEWRHFSLGVNDTQITHGYCPECFAETMVQLEDYIGAKTVEAFSAVGWPLCNEHGGPCA